MTTTPIVNVDLTVGDASAINGVTTTTPNQSTRPGSEISQVIGVNGGNAAVNLFPGPVQGASFNPAGDPTGSLVAGAGVFSANINLNTTASTLFTNTSTPFAGSSAISGGTALGLANANPFRTGNVFDPSNPSAPGQLFALASGQANSTAFTGGTPDSNAPNVSAAAVVDLAGAGVSNAATYLRNLDTFTAQSALTGNAKASSTTGVGAITAPYANSTTPPALNTPLSSTGVSSVLNLNSRGLNGQSTYFQDGIAPFFAQFGGLQQQGPITSVPFGLSFDINGSGNFNAQASAQGSSTATNNGSGDTNAFSGIFSTGALLNSSNASYYRIIGAGDFTASSLVGDTGASSNSANPVDTSSSTQTGSSSAVSNLVSIGAGTAAVRATAASPALIAPSTIQVNNGDVTGSAVNRATTSASAGSGDATAFTGGLQGSGGNPLATAFKPGNSLTIGLFNVDLAVGNGANNGNVLGSAISDLTTSASSSVAGNAFASNTGNTPTLQDGPITAGIIGLDFSASMSTPPVPANTDITVFNGNVRGTANAGNTILASANGLTNGPATATANSVSSTFGIANNNINVQTGVVSGIANAVDTVRANAVLGTSAAQAFATVAGITNSPVSVASTGGIGGSASLTSTVTSGITFP